MIIWTYIITAPQNSCDPWRPLNYVKSTIVRLPQHVATTHQ